MPAPYDYTIKPPDLTQSFMSGLQPMVALAKIKQEADKAEREKMFREDFGKLLTTGSPQASIDLVSKYPEYVTQIQAASKMHDDVENKTEFDFAKKLFGAVNNDQVDYAKQLTQQHLDAAKNSGKDARDYELILKGLTEGNPKSVAGMIASKAAAYNPDEWTKFATAMTSAEKAQAETAEARAKAQKAATQARFAESQAVADLTKTGWDIQKLQNDISVSKENQRIAAMQAEAKKTTDALQLQELQGKIADAEAARDQKVRERVADLSNANANAQNLFNTVDDIIGKSFERDDKGEIVYEKDAKGNKVPVFSGVLKSATGPIESMLPTFSQDVADLEEQVNTLKSQVTMANIDKLKGVLSDNDMKTLQTALQSLSLRQSPQALVKNLTTIKDLTKNAQDIAKNKYGLPENMPAPQQEVSVSVPGVGAIKFPNQKAADDFMQKLKSRGGL